MTKLLLFSVRGKVRLLTSVAFTMLITVFFSSFSFAQELIMNPGFESKLTGWQSNKSPIRTVAATNPIHSGVYAAHINNASQDNEYFFQNLNASPFGSYSFSVWAMVHDASKKSTVGVNVYDANWVKITSASVKMEVNSTTFQKYAKDFTLPNNARYLQVFGYAESTVLKVDDYSLTQAVGGNPTGTVTKNCKIENFRKCDGTNVGYGPWLNILINGAGGGSSNEYNVSGLTWQEYSDNTATVKGTITKKNDATVAFAVDLLLKGKTTSGSGHFSSVDNNSFCVSQKGADWYFYPNASGTLIGTGSSVTGSQINVTLDPSMPWQVGTGGTTRFKSSFGSSAWVDMCVVKQPTTGKTLSIGKEGTDFYLEMPGCTPVVCNNVTSGGSIGSNQSGCSGFDPAAFTSVTDPSGGGTTALEIIWLKSTTSSVLTTATQSQWITIAGATGLTYNADPLTQTTYFTRCSRRAGCTDYVGEANVITVTINANCGGKDPVCISRKSPVQNSSLCGDATNSYGMWFSDLKGNVASPNQQFSVKSGELTEFCDGTAVLNYTACVTGGGANDCITAIVNYSGRTGTPPAGSPVLNTHCTTYSPNVGDWYYYPTSNGSFSGAGIYAGLTGTYTQNMGAFQLGTGGNLNDISKFGASSWFKINITNGGTNHWSTVSKDGDININLGTSTNIASVTATANPNAICKGSDVNLKATIDVASKSANCSPTYSWVGSNGFTSNQATVTNTNVQGATTYTVTVTFTAVNGSKCSVTATTAVTLNAVCCDNVTNGGQIGSNQQSCGAFDPAPFTNVQLPTGGTGTLEYVWLKSTTATTFTTENVSEWVPIAGTNSPTLDVNNISVTTAYQRCSRRAGCTDYNGETNVIVVTIYKVPTAPTTTPSAICGTGKVTLGASCTTGIAQWYAASTGGITLATGASFTTPSISTSTPYYVSCKSPEGCESTPRIEAKATVSDNANPPSVTPGSICGTGTVTLGATCTSGIAQWYTNGTGGSSIATGASFTTPSLTSSTTYYVSCKSSGGCESSRIEVKATVIGKITDGGTIKADETICVGGIPAKITSVTPASGGDASLAIEYIWLQTTSLSSNGVCPLNVIGQNLYSPIPNTNTADYQPGAITQTTCYIRCSRRAGCTDYIGGESNTVKKAVETTSTAPSVTPGSICGTGTVTLGASCTSGTPMWYIFGATGGGIVATGSSFTTPSLTSSITYYVSCKSSGGCESSRIEVKATVISKITDGGTIKADETICVGGIPAKITSVTPASGGDASLAIEYIWLQTTSLSSNGVCPLNVIGQNLYSPIPNTNTADYQPGAITQTTCYIRCSRRAGCTDYIGGESNTVKKAVTSPFTISATTNPNAVCAGTTVNITLTTDATGTITYSWVGPNGFTANTKDVSIPNATLLANGVYTVSASNGGGCSAVATVNVKVVGCLKIGDLVFNDKNNNGKQEAGELGIVGVTVKLFDGANNQVGSSTTTDANGNYLFSNLPAGNYVVEISAPVGYKSSTGTNGSATGVYEPATSPATNVNNEDNGTNVSGQIIRSKSIALTTTDNTNVDFGLFRPAKLGDTVFRDFNGNGIQDVGEGGVAGVTVKLYDSANNVIASTTTDANGKYLFDNLTAGNYTVEFVKSTLATGFNFSPQGAATTPDKDSDANVTTGKTGTITLTEGQTNNDVDAGVTTPCDIDKTPPVLTSCPYDVLIKTRGISAIVSWIAPTATDNCGTPVITSTSASGSQFPVGTTTVTYTATDAKGNKMTCSFTVTVVKIITCDVDTQAPVFYDCPTDITLNTTGTGAVANWDHPSVGDNCGIPSVVFNYSPGQTFPVGVTTVIYTAKDAKGNTSYCMFKVTVIKTTTLLKPVTESMNTTALTTIITLSSSRLVVNEGVKVGDEISIYPNPSSSDFLIELSTELMKANSSVEVSVFNMTGNTQFTQTAKGTERVSVKVPVHDMPNGTYFVNVGLDNGRMIIKKLQIIK